LSRIEVAKITKKWSPTRRKMVFDISFKVLPSISERTVAVGEAFGLGLDKEQEFPVYSSFELEIGLDDVVYITGPSGSGKSVLLRALKAELGPLVADMADVEVGLGVPIVDTVGRDVDEAIRLLTTAGLSDVFLWLRTYEELSDGQRYRYRLARLLESGAQIWMCDEFCSTLDRDTAKVVAFSIQKVARRLGKGLIVATTHTDLFEDLRPSVYVVKGLGPEVSVFYYPNEPAPECSLAKEVSFYIASDPPRRSEALKLIGKWHYRGRKPPHKHIVVAERKGRIIGAVLLSPPYVACWGRKLVFKKPPSLKELNRWFYTISRIVLHPLYRGIGLGKKLLKAALLASDRPYVELVAVMARYNRFAEAAGMVKVGEKGPEPAIEEAVRELRELGIDDRLMASERYGLRILSKMDEASLERVREILASLRNLGLMRSLLTSHEAYPKPEGWENLMRKADIACLARALSILAFLRARKIYLIWRHPGIAYGGCPLDDLVKPEWRDKLFGEVKGRGGT